jgi:hypothetical protein
MSIRIQVVEAAWAVFRENSSERQLPEVIDDAPTWARVLVSSVANAIMPLIEAHAAERERCAKVADDHGTWGADIAAAIRQGTDATPTPLDKAREALAAVERVAQMLYVAKGAATLFGPWGAQLYPNVKEPFLRQARTELAPLLAEHERLADRVAKLEAFVFDLVSGATGDLSAAKLATTCALTMPKAEEIAAVAQEWFDRETSALLTPAEGADDGR